jgi:hypothetical protein
MKDNGDGSYTLTQEGLIRKILEVTKMADCEAKSTPATTTPLCSDPNGCDVLSTGLSLVPIVTPKLQGGSMSGRES